MQCQLTNFEVDSVVETDSSVCAVFKPVWISISVPNFGLLNSSLEEEHTSICVSKTGRKKDNCPDKNLNHCILYFTHAGHSLLSLQGDFETTCVSSPGDISKTFLQNLLTFSFLLLYFQKIVVFSKFYEFVIVFMYTAMEMHVSPNKIVVQLTVVGYV